jgi:hypothetical protein
MENNSKHKTQNVLNKLTITKPDKGKTSIIFIEEEYEH